jgi:hypothetical protein
MSEKIEITDLKEPEVISTVLISQLLVDILVKNDDIKSFADKITVKVSNKTLETLKLILNKAPETLDKIVDNVKDILRDGIIDHKDISKIIILVTNLYKTDFKNVITSKALTTTEIVEFIKFILKMVIDFDYVQVKNKQEIFDIIEASTSLLEMVIPPQKIKCNWFLCLKKQNI